MEVFTSAKILASPNFTFFPSDPTTAQPAIYLALFAVLIIFLLRISKEPSNDIPSPKYGWPIVGNVIAYGKNPVAYLRKATAQCGKVFKVDMLLMKTVWLRSTELNKLYLETREDTWSFGDGMGLFLYKIVNPGYFDNLKMFVASLNRGINRKSALDHYSEIMNETSESYFSKWAEKPDMDLFEHISVLVHAIIVQCLMGPDFYAKNGEELYHLLHEMEADIGNTLNFILPDWVPHPAARRLKQQKDRVGEIFAERLKEREMNPERWVDAKDYISYTLSDGITARLKHYYASHHTLLMFAAHTSTVASISWTILELLKSPAQVDRLRQDLSRNPDPRSSPALDAFLKETGRCYSGISMLRLARQSTNYPATGTHIPQGSVVSISPYLTHRDPDIWSHVDEWYPERWLENPDLAKQVNSDGKLAYMPFGAGSHRCPGEKLAGMIAATVVGTLFQSYDVTFGKGGEKQNLSELDFSKIGSPWLKGDASVRVQKRDR